MPIRPVIINKKSLNIRIAKANSKLGVAKVLIPAMAIYKTVSDKIPTLTAKSLSKPPIIPKKYLGHWVYELKIF